MKYLQPTLITISMLAIVAGVLWYSDKRDEKRDELWKKYTECVIEQFHASPAEIYRITGNVPECYSSER